jgi:hypothetical protein
MAIVTTIDNTQANELAQLRTTITQAAALSELDCHLARHHLERCPAGTDGLPLYVRLKGWLKRQEVLVRPLGFKGL